VALDCIVGGGKKGTVIEPVEGGDEPCALQETKESGVIRVLRKLVNEGGRGRVLGRVKCELWVVSGKRVREEGKEGEGNERRETHLNRWGRDSEGLRGL
jgi:hypothetical protein